MSANENVFTWQYPMSYFDKILNCQFCHGFVIILHSVSVYIYELFTEINEEKR